MRSFFYRSLLLPALAAFALACLTPARACIHLPRDYKGVVTEKTKEALLFRVGKNVHLIIKTSLQSPGTLPDTMAWVIPLPSLPSHYEEADPALFPELFRVTEDEGLFRKTLGLPMVGGRTKSASISIKVHPEQIVGSYRIWPIEIRSVRNGGAALNNWLTQNGFGAVPVENQRYYLHKGAVFLALKITHLTGSTADIKPLHIVYKADKLTLPLKFSTHSGPFNVLLYTFAPERPKVSSFTSLFRTSYLNATGCAPIGAPNVSAPLLARLTGHRSGYLTRYEGYYNTSDHLVKDLSADPSFPARTKAAAKGLTLAYERGYTGRHN